MFHLYVSVHMIHDIHCTTQKDQQTSNGAKKKEDEEGK